MKLRILSDIHLEFRHYTLPPLPTDKDSILVLAGDISLGAKASGFIVEQASRFKHIIYVLGNHEFYDNHVPSVRAFWANHNLDNLTVLDDSVKIIDGIRFVGGTLWTDLDKLNWSTIQDAKMHMPDFNCVTYKNGKTFTPQDSATLHNITKNFIINQLKDGYDGKTVVVTHHMPHRDCVHSRFTNDSLNGAFKSDLDELFNEELALWIHGHTHDTVDIMVNDTRIVCNPLGYPSEQPYNSCNEELVIEL